MEKAFDYIQKRCREAGYPMTKLCESLGIPTWRVWHWKKHDPKPVDDFRRMEQELDRIIASKS